MTRTFAIGRTPKSPNAMLAQGLWYYPMAIGLDQVVPYLVAVQRPRSDVSVVLDESGIVPKTEVVKTDDGRAPVIVKSARSKPEITDIDSPY